MKKILPLIVFIVMLFGTTQSQISIVSHNVTCRDSCNGSVAINTAGYYYYHWNTGATTPRITGLCAGIYSVTATDSTGQAVDSLITIITEPSSYVMLSLDSVHQASCPVLNDGAIFVHATGGSAPYTYDWSNGAVQSSISNLSPGIYNVWAHDSLGCINHNLLNNVIINNSILIDTAAFIIPDCNHVHDGKIKVKATGGNAPYYYLWSNNSTSDSIDHLLPGLYAVTVTDHLGCSASYTFNLPATTFQVVIGHSDARCVNNWMGNASAQVFGGAPYNYSYQWSTGQTSQWIGSLSAGTYYLTVTDTTGCSVVTSVQISQSSFNYHVFIQADSFPDCQNNNGVLSVTVPYIQAPVTYHWSTGAATSTISSLPDGNYSLTVTDANGCTASGVYHLPINCGDTLSGIIFNDLNGNCIMDSGDTPLPGAAIAVEKGVQHYYSYSDSLGYYSILISDTGTYSLIYYNVPCGVLTACNNPNSTVTFTGFPQAVQQNFAFTGASGFNLGVHAGWNSANPGFFKNYWVYYYNQSYPPYTGPATIVFQYDSNLIYQSSAPPLPAHNPVAHTLTWNVTVSANVNWVMLGPSHFLVPATLPIGYHLKSDFFISPVIGDCDTTNNHIHYSEVITNSYDPNRKEVSPAGQITDDDSVLTYTVHFQNTGTDTSQFVIVQDTLNSNLNPLTVRNIASSHRYTDFNISGSGILTWVFNPINLVDSNTNAQASKGFVTFSVHKKQNLPPGVIISNRASIVFDYNLPMLTNTVFDTIIYPDNVSIIGKSTGVKVVVIPNPFNDETRIVVNGLKDKFAFILYDLTGRRLKSINAIQTKSFELRREDLPSGIYFYQILVDGQNVANGKLMME